MSKTRWVLCNFHISHRNVTKYSPVSCPLNRFHNGREKASCHTKKARFKGKRAKRKFVHNVKSGVDRLRRKCGDGRNLKNELSVLAARHCFIDWPATWSCPKEMQFSKEESTFEHNSIVSLLFFMFIVALLATIHHSVENIYSSQFVPWAERPFNSTQERETIANCWKVKQFDIE